MNIVSKFFYKLWGKFLTMFGDIKIFKYPFWVVYDPDYFKMSGEKILDAMDTLKPGDVLLRGYDHYLDGVFISLNKPYDLESGQKCIGNGGDYSHGAIYIGNNQIIHAVAPNVDIVSTIEFMECDRICILRPRKGAKRAIARAKKFLKDKISYDYAFSRGNGASQLYCFELAAECYKELNTPLYKTKSFFGLIQKTVFLARSFKDSKDYEVVFEYNPKYGVDFKKV